MILGYYLPEFMMSETFLWIFIIGSFILWLCVAHALSKESNGFMSDYFGIPTADKLLENLPDEITIEIVKENPEQETPSVSQTEPSALPGSASELLSSDDVCHPTQKAGYVPE